MRTDRRQKQRALSWVTTGTIAERRRRRTLREAFLAVSNRERVATAAGDFEPARHPTHSATAVAVETLAHSCLQIPRLLLVPIRVSPLREPRRRSDPQRGTEKRPRHRAARGLRDLSVPWDDLLELRYWFTTDDGQENAATRAVRREVVTYCSSFATEFLLNEDLEGWRYLARCERARCGRIFIRKDARQRFCRDACRRGHFDDVLFGAARKRSSDHLRA